MKEVEYLEVIEWVWQCPECACWNEIETDNDPVGMDVVGCNNCDSEFKLVPG